MTAQRPPRGQGGVPRGGSVSERRVGQFRSGRNSRARASGTTSVRGARAGPPLPSSKGACPLRSSRSSSETSGVVRWSPAGRSGRPARIQVEGFVLVGAQLARVATGVRAYCRDCGISSTGLVRSTSVLLQPSWPPGYFSPGERHRGWLPRRIFRREDGSTRRLLRSARVRFSQPATDLPISCSRLGSRQEPPTPSRGARTARPLRKAVLYPTELRARAGRSVAVQRR
jgi:hypothetical protein